MKTINVGRSVRMAILCVAAIMFVQGCAPTLEFDESSLLTDSEIVTCNSELIELLFDHMGGKASVTVKSNKDWTVAALNDRAGSWLKFGPESGAKDGIINISVADNTTHEERSATLIVSGADDLKTTIRIVQKQDDALTISSNKVEMDKEGGSFEVQVRHNIDYAVEIGEACSSWLHKSSTRAMVTDKVMFTVDPNTTIYPRQGQIRISSSLGEEIVNVYQTGEDPVLVLSTLDVNVTSGQNVFTVDVSSNTNVEYSISADWIKELVSRTVSTDRYTFAVSENGKFEARTAQIVFSSTESDLTEVVTVTQAQKDALIASKDHYQVASEGAVISVEVGHNVRYSAAVGSDWIKEVKTRSFDSDELTFAIEKNETYDIRRGEIVFTSEDNSLRQVVTIEQAQKDALFVFADTLDVSNKGGVFDIDVSSNVEFSVEIEKGVDWVSRVQTRGLVTSTYTFAAAKSDIDEKRYAHIVFSNGALSQKVVIAQGPADNLKIIPQGPTTVPFEGGEVIFTVEANLKYEIDKSLIPSWAEMSWSDGTYKLILAANSSPETRTMKVRAASMESDTEAIMEIAQEGRPKDSYLNKTWYGVYKIDGRNYEGAHTTTQNRVIRYKDHYSFSVIFPSENTAVLFPSLDYSIQAGDRVSFGYSIFTDEGVEERTATAKVDQVDSGHLWMKADNGVEFIIKKVEGK